MFKTKHFLNFHLINNINNNFPEWVLKKTGIVCESIEKVEMLELDWSKIFVTNQILIANNWHLFYSYEGE